jgi:GNAT superfamily N-acetyltransferase
MSDFSHQQAGWTEDDLNAIPLDGDPPGGFDCGKDDQNQFLYERAWRDHEAGVSGTYLFYVKGMLAGYVTLMTDALLLHKRERGRGVHYQTVSAVKLCQLGVGVEFQGQGLGKQLVAFAVQIALTVANFVGCRYLTLEARPELVEFYEKQGFVQNELAQEVRKRDARAHSRNPDGIPVSMRFDLREPGS